MIAFITYPLTHSTKEETTIPCNCVLALEYFPFRHLPFLLILNIPNFYHALKFVMSPNIASIPDLFRHADFLECNSIR